MSSFKVIILGGGLAGSLLANGLINNAIDCAVYERDSRGSKREGYQIRLGASALAGFRACLDKTQMEPLLKLFGRSGGLKSAAPILYDAQFNCLIDLTKFSAYSKSAPINRVVLRDFLQEYIYKAGKLHYEKKFVQYHVIREPGKPDQIKVEFSDGTFDQGDLLISAEGSHSKVNSQVGLNNIVQLYRKWGFLAKGNLPLEKLSKLTPLLRKGPVACNVGGTVLFCSAYLPEGTKETEPGGPSYDESLASLFWGLSVPATEVSPEGGKALKDKLQFCLDRTKGWDPAYHDIMRALDEEEIYAFQARASTEPAKGWRQKAQVAEDPGRGHDRVWLIGDAIHPMLPSRGMGGNQSMHDTADALSAIQSMNLSSGAGLPSEQQIHAAVVRYETKMLPRAFGWVKTSGGLGGSDPPDSTTIKGRIMLFFVKGLLLVLSAFASIRRAFGYRPVDDAPEFL